MYRLSESMHRTDSHEVQTDFIVRFRTIVLGCPSVRKNFSFFFVIFFTASEVT